MLSEIILQDMKFFVKKLMEKECVDTYDVKIQGQPKSGENYVGEVIFLQVTAKDVGRIFNLVMKTARRSDELREKFPVVTQYKRELFAYSEIFPAFRGFIMEKDSKYPFDFVPEDYWLFHEEKRETLIFKDLKFDGYKMLNPQKTWNLEHILFVMEHYGKFHALSMALEQQNPEIFERLIHELHPLNFEYHNVLNVPEYINNIVKYSIELLRGAGRMDLVRKFEEIRKEFDDAMKYVIAVEDRVVICHGDCWNNNFLFKYEGEDCSRPSKVCFLDFQLMLSHSPIADLSVNIYTTCDKKALEHFDLLLETYYESLSNNIKKLGSDPTNLFTYDQLKRHWRKYALFGLLLAHVSVKYAVFNTNEAPDFTEISEGKRDFHDCLTYQGENQEEFDRRILDVFTHFGENFL